MRSLSRQFWEGSPTRSPDSCPEPMRRWDVGRGRYLMSDASYADAIGRIRHSELSTIKLETANSVPGVLSVRRAERKS